ncbi:uncharacterized protein TNIN_156091 [Trichonephila inaurata madagascariensis]|uniref:Uncharacterized protein n=1 Tax=Trichonephila inaurata madagascariensis TaxID=2747483 RepID=A0A8X6Y7X2_9ARAC|nr:uncharacterized protein TNIN_156091 [Trichonephila inaurata madagascariensis]
MDQTFKYIFLLFCCCAVTSLTNVSNRKIISRLYRILLGFLNAIFILALSSATLSLTICFQNTVLSASINVSCIVIVILRCALLKKINQLKYITALLGEFKVRKAEENILWLKVLIVLTVLSQTFILAYKLSLPKEVMDVSYFLFGYTVQRKLYRDAITILFDINSLFFAFMPLLTFVLFYTAVCHRASSIIQRFGDTLAKKNEFNYEMILHSYTRIKSAVNFIDNKVGFLVFTTVLYSSCILCFALYYVMESSMFTHTLDRLIIFHQIFSTLLMLIIMSISASRVGEASSEISSLALNLPKSKEGSSFYQQRFIMLAEKEITMTVWRIVPIRRSFIFSISGVLFTYTLMFYNMNPYKNK